MVTADSVKTKLQGLIAKANETTGNSDTDLTAAVNALVAGFGQVGGDTSIEDSFMEGTLTTYSNDRVTTVGNSVFSGWTSLTDVSFPNVTTVGDSAFQNCTALTEVSFPNVTIAGGSAFRDCSALSEISFPKLQIISANIFRGSGIEKITDEQMPSATTITGNYSFSGCKKLKYFQHSMRYHYQSRSFQGCNALEKVDIHATGLAYYVFSGCLLTALILRRTDAICELSNTNAIENSDITKGTGYVYVPSALLEEYKAATNWSLYAEQFRAIEDYPEICEVGA